MVFTPTDRGELLAAREAWLSDPYAALETYGPLSEWDTSRVPPQDGDARVRGGALAPKACGGVPALVKMVRAGSMPVKLFGGKDVRTKKEIEADVFNKRNAEKAAVSLARMAQQPSARLLIAAADGAIPALIGLMNGGTPAARGHGAGALRSLAANASLHDQIFAAVYKWGDEPVGCLEVRERTFRENVPPPGTFPVFL